MKARLALGSLVVAAAIVLLSAPASAHPLGNFTVNRSAEVTLGPGRVEVGYIIDEAEIPAFQDRQAIERRGAEAWARSRCDSSARGLAIAINGDPVALRVTTEPQPSLSFPPGAGGLATLRLECRLAGRSDVRAGRVSVTVIDGNETARVGWREVVVTGSGVAIDGSDVPAVSPSGSLTAYPREQLSSPLDIRRAHVTGTVDRAAAPPRVSRPVVGPRVLPLGAAQANRFAALVTRHDRTPWFFVSAIVLAVVLGGLHAFAPGHGKTVMAAYLIGERGRARDAALIATTVTLTHTAGVLGLGALLAASRLASPERIYPWLTLASGLLFVIFGLSIANRARRRRRHAREHREGHAHGHDHHHDHDHSAATIGWRSALWLGLAGGMVPTPSALVVLVGAIAIGQVAFGVVLVACYGLGMALALTGVGLLLARGRRALHAGHGRWRRLTRLSESPLLPALASLAIVVTGSSILLRGLLALT